MSILDPELIPQGAGRGVHVGPGVGTPRPRGRHRPRLHTQETRNMASRWKYCMLLLISYKLNTLYTSHCIAIALA